MQMISLRSRPGRSVVKARHEHHVLGFAVDDPDPEFHSFLLEPELAVEGDGRGVVGVDIEFDPGESASGTGAEGAFDQAAAPTLSAPLRKQSHAETSDMIEPGPRQGRDDVAPTGDDPVGGDGDDVGIADGEIGPDEVVGGAQSESFNGGEPATFACHEIGAIGDTGGIARGDGADEEWGGRHSGVLHGAITAA